jgi:hypothetical protein
MASRKGHCPEEFSMGSPIPEFDALDVPANVDQSRRDLPAIRMNGIGRVRDLICRWMATFPRGDPRRMMAPRPSLRCMPNANDSQASKSAFDAG